MFEWYNDLHCVWMILWFALQMTSFWNKLYNIEAFVTRIAKSLEYWNKKLIVEHKSNTFFNDAKNFCQLQNLT